MVYITVLLELRLFESFSLKDKRQIIRSIIEKLNNRYNVAISEVGKNDDYTRGSLGLVVIGNDFKHLESMVDKIINKLDQDYRFELIDIIKKYHSEEESKF